MLTSIYFISLLSILTLSIYLLDKSNINEKFKPFTEGLIFGLIGVIGMNIHYSFIEPTALFPKINIFLSHAFLVSISFFSFGLKSGLITLLMLFTARIFLTNEFLISSLFLLVLSSLNGYIFNKKYYSEIQEYVSLKKIILFLISQSTIYVLIFFLGPLSAFYDRLYQMLIFLIFISSFVTGVIILSISRSRIQSNLILKLKYSDAIFTNLIYYLSEALVIVDEKCRILRINNLAEKLFGINSKEVENKNLFQICLIKDENKSAELKSKITNLNENDVLNYYDIEIISKNGVEISVDCNVSTFYEKSTKQRIIVILFRDIREFKESKRILEESEKRFRQFIDFSSEGIFRYEITKPVDITLPPAEQVKMFFEYGYLAECNDVFARMYGYQSKNDLIGIPLTATLIPDDENNVEYLKNFVINNYRISNAESVEKDKAGNVKYFVNSLYGIIENGFIVGAWGIQIDVTEDKLTTKQIRDNNRLLLSILNAPRGIIIFSLDRNYCYTAFSVSHKQTMKKIWGVDIEIGMNMLDAIKYEKDRIKAKNNFDRALKGEYLNLIEEYGDENLQRTFWLDNYSPIFDGSEIIGVAVYVTDISLQKKFEEELKKKNLLLYTLINTLPDSIYVKDKDLRKILTNKTDLLWMGYKDEKEVLGKRDDEIFGEEFAKSTIADDLKVIQGNPIINREEKIITKDNRVIYISTTKVPMFNEEGEIIGLVGVSRDITKLKNYMNQLEENQQKLKILFDQSFQFVGLLDSKGILLEANKTACNFIGVDENEVKNKPFVDTPWWNHSEEEQKKLLDAIKFASNGNFYRMETTHPNKNNEIRTVDFSLNPIFDSQGKVIYLIAEGRDITDIKKLELKLEESEEKYKILVEASMDAISIINPNGVILFSNEKHKELFKYFEVEQNQHNYFDFIHKDDASKFDNLIKSTLELGAVTFSSLKFMKNKNDFFWAEINLKKFKDIEQNDLCICVLRDITYRKNIEDEMKKRVYELERINKMMVGREMKMVELKKEINSLLKQLGKPPKFTEDDLI